jgi:hypothetical protein
MKMRYVVHIDHSHDKAVGHSADCDVVKWMGGWLGPFDSRDAAESAAKLSGNVSIGAAIAVGFQGTLQLR